MDIKGAVFDLDRTLSYTEPCFEAANQVLIDKYGNKKSYLEDWEIKIKSV